jgi:hypothetical protein
MGKNNMNHLTSSPLFNSRLISTVVSTRSKHLSSLGAVASYIGLFQNKTRHTMEMAHRGKGQLLGNQLDCREVRLILASHKSQYICHVKYPPNYRENFTGTQPLGQFSHTKTKMTRMSGHKLEELESASHKVSDHHIHHE